MNNMTGIARELKTGGEVSVYTIIDGAGAGERAAYSKSLTERSADYSAFFDGLHAKHIEGGTIVSADGRRVFVEKAKGAPRLLVCGGGHVSLPLVKVCAMLDFSVMVIDDRAEFANASRFPDAKRVYCGDFLCGIDEFAPTGGDYFVLITRGHANDRSCLEKILAGEHSYVGMIGSRSKIKAVYTHMLENGFTQDQLDAVHSPIGLMIGAQTPNEIAVSIAAELIKFRSSNGSGFSSDMLDALLDMSSPCAMATIIKKNGSAPRGVGARMLVKGDGTFIGSIGGGSGEHAMVNNAKSIIANGGCGIFHCEMSNKDASKQGMVCGGDIDVFIERV